jgi:D-serine deaminase-like pyridoxal phosphate-dependent protein
MMTNAHLLTDLPTPCLVLDAAKCRANIARLADRLAPFGVSLRPHLKTAKSIDAARMMLTGPTGPAMVSTLAEAEYFAGHGVTDLTYGVGIAPAKLDRVGGIRRQSGADLAVILDSVAQAEAVAAWSRDHGERLPAFIEIDTDGTRAGVKPTDTERLVAIGRALASGAELRGVLTHFGGSYGSDTPDALAADAEQERSGIVAAAEVLRAAGLACPVVSVGSTPTAHFTRNLDGVTEVRAGVYVFGDLTQANIGVMPLDAISLSVLATVIGSHGEGGAIVDAGWMALSRDRSTASQRIDYGYGLVCDAEGRVVDDLIVTQTSQEHGVLAMRPGSGRAPPKLPVGTLLRILPNHACATAAQHGHYHVIDGGKLERWERMNGW